MHLQINFTWWWLVAIGITFLFLVLVTYRLVKRFMRKCPCGSWFRVERIKMMEPDPNALNDTIFGEMYFVYILGQCNKCRRVLLYKIYCKRFTTLELAWRHLFHSIEFNRSDSQALLEAVGVDLHGHLSGERVGHKPKIQKVFPIHKLEQPRSYSGKV